MLLNSSSSEDKNILLTVFSFLFCYIVVWLVPGGSLDGASCVYSGLIWPQLLRQLFKQSSSFLMMGKNQRILKTVHKLATGIAPAFCLWKFPIIWWVTHWQKKIISSIASNLIINFLKYSFCVIQTPQKNNQI